MKITDKVCCGITILIIFVYLGLMGASFAMGPMEHIAKPYDMNGTNNLNNIKDNYVKDHIYIF